MIFVYSFNSVPWEKVELYTSIDYVNHEFYLQKQCTSRQSVLFQQALSQSHVSKKNKQKKNLSLKPLKRSVDHRPI